MSIKKIFLFFIAARPRLFGRQKYFFKYYFKYLSGPVMSVHDVQDTLVWPGHVTRVKWHIVY